MSRCTLLVVRQSGKRLSRRRAMRRRKRASLDVRRIPSTRERRRNMSQCCCERGMRAFAATPSERRAIAEQANPVFLLVVGGESDGGVSCPLWRSLGVAAKVRIPVSPSIGTYYADVPACSECVERRATHACATSSRIGVRAACLTA